MLESNPPRNTQSETHPDDGSERALSVAFLSLHRRRSTEGGCPVPGF